MWKAGGGDASGGQRASPLETLPVRAVAFRNAVDEAVVGCGRLGCTGGLTLPGTDRGNPSFAAVPGPCPLKNLPTAQETTPGQAPVANLAW